MTRFERINAGSGHSYRLDGHDVPGVTTIIGTLDKPALVNWAAEQSASYAIDNWARLSGVPLAQRLKEIQNARYNTNRAAVVKGNRLHALAERLQQTGDTGEIPAELVPQVEAIARFLDTWELDAIHTETPVCNTGYRYAGTLDTISTSPRLGRILLDFKTGKGVYDDFTLQLAAYANSDLMLVPHTEIGPRGGKKTVWNEQVMPQVDGCYVAHVLGDTIDLHPLTVDDQVFAAFLHLREVYALWVERTGWKFRDRPTYAPTVQKPIYIEDRPRPIVGAQK